MRHAIKSAHIRRRVTCCVATPILPAPSEGQRGDYLGQLPASRGTHGTQERGHHLAQGVALGYPRADKKRQTPQALGLNHPTPERGAAVKLELEMTLKLVLEGGVMLGGAQ